MSSEFASAGLTAGQLNAIVKKLGGHDMALRFLRGDLQVTTVHYIIDCDADPFTPEGWKVEEHNKMGQLEWDPTRVILYLSPNQKDGKYVEGNKLRKELADKPVLNANVLDHLLANPHLIPKEWKVGEQDHARYIFFWGTIYRYSNGYLCVRCLYFVGSRWRWVYFWLDYVWVGSGPAVCLAS